VIESPLPRRRPLREGGRSGTPFEAGSEERMALRLKSVCKRYRGRDALAGVSLHVRPGDCYGFLGHNGAGKTTALRIALGLIRADSGSVTVDGFDAARHPREARARQGGLIETPSFYPWLSGRKNLVIHAGLEGLDRREGRKEADRLLSAVGLSYAADRAAGGYSQGMRQRLGIALALFGDPTLILLDEPMNGLDPEGIEEMRSLLVRLTKEEGKTVLMSSHQLHEVAGICNRVGILREGELLAEAETKVLLADSSGRLTLRTSDDDAALAVLAEFGLETEEGPDPGLLVRAGDFPPAQIARELVTRDIEINEIAPRSASLEEIYLAFSRGERTAAPALEAEPDAVENAPPAERRAPRRPIFRAFTFELRRFRSHLLPAVALALPAILALLSVLRIWGKSAGHLQQVEEGELYSATSVTAFEGVAVALQDSLFLAAIVVAGLASQSLAGEHSRGTLRNLLLRPVGRVPLTLGKSLGVLAVALVCFASVCGVAFVAAAAAFDFTDVVEIMEIRSAEPWVVQEAAVLWPVLRSMVPALGLTLLAYAGLGFLAGALTKRSVTALSLSIGLVVFLDLLRAVGRELGFERFLLSAYLPSPLGDTSYTRHLLDLIRAPNSVARGYLDGSLLVPSVWLALALALSAWLLSRRSVP